MSQTDATGDAGGEAAGPGAAGVDRRQVALVALCLLGLVVAAFVAPLAPDRGGLGDAGGGEVGDGSGGGDNGGGASGGESRPNGGGGDGDVVRDDGDPIPVPGGDAPPTAHGCAVVVQNEPVPGAVVAVRVWNDREPAAGVRVWFGDRHVGRTDDTGRVTGRAPYTRELNVTVRVPGADCEFYRRPYEDVRSTDLGAPGQSGRLGSELGASLGSLDAPLRSPTGLDAGTPFAPHARRAAVPFQRETPDDRNDTAPYDVHGSVNVTVLGEPYPGETVTVLAAVDDVPMRRATVRADGERVGETTVDGRYALEIPGDGERFTVTVERGDFSGSTTVDVLLLDAAIVPRDGLAFPGEPALVNATVGGQPRPDARVALDGSRLGSTDSDGSVRLALPTDLRETVTVETDRQAATTPVWSAYAPTILLSVLLVFAGVVGVTAAARARGRSATRRVATWWTAVATVFAALVVWERLGLLVATGLVSLGAAVANRGAVRSGGSSAAGGLRALAAFARRTALSVADWVAVALDRLRALLGRLGARVAALPLSARGLAGRLWDWFRVLPDRVRAFATARLSARRTGAVALAFALAVALGARFGPLGVLAALVALSVGLLAYRWATREDSEVDGDVETDTGSAVAGTASRPAADDGPKRRSLRAVWRRFARWVRPHSWRQSTPGEVSRAAIERGFPERPVRVLTEAFREVEYGDRPSDDRTEAARDAFESIERERGDEGP